jgi:glycosyltransferase involved in cell wall biosynthesis
VNILFIHGNYPAQFQSLARLTGADARHRVVFLTARAGASSDPIPGVEIRQFQRAREPRPETHHYLHATEEAVLNGQAVLRSVDQLLQEGFQPDLVITHGGTGLGLFIKDLLPQAKLIGLFEWWCKPETSRWLFAEFPFDTQLKSELTNLVIQQELLHCDTAVVPTAWQAQQFPAVWQPKLRVVFDGINTDFFQPPPLELSRSLQLNCEDGAPPVLIKPEHTLLSYATRGMEPVRGFPEFMNALPELLAEDPQLQVVIAGRDRCAYSYTAPRPDGSWKQHCLEQLGDFEGRERIHFTGLLSYAQYRELLWRTDAHCSFSRPYVLSWSLFEALACATPLVLSESDAYRSAVPETTDAAWVNLDEPRSISGGIRQQLNRTTRSDASQIHKKFSVQESVRGWNAVVKEISG